MIRKNYRKLKKELLVSAYGSKCVVCGYSNAITALEFHHINEDTKKFNISQDHNIKWEILLEEVKKCMLVCCRCHREIHEKLIDITNIKQEIDISPIKDLFERPIKKVKKCFCCGKPTYNKFCSIECSAKTQERINWNDQELIDLYVVKNVNVLQLSKIYKLSYNSVKKRLKKLKVFKIPS
jgi:hypothetical protein